MLLPRVDFVGVLEIVADAAAAKSTPGHVPAEITPEGYLEAYALTARDGLLVYSDGSRSWQEFRPRAELEDTLDAWAFVPTSDGHPPSMITAGTWSTFARGHGLGAPEIVELDGIAYTRQRLRFADAGLVDKIKGGAQLEVSIGFLSDVVRADEYKGGPVPKGAEAVQTALIPNHVASVPRGRAGPQVRVLLDGADVPVCWPGLASGFVPYPKQDMQDEPKDDKPKGDEIGSPATEIEVVGPDGQKHMVPSFIVAELEQLRARAGQQPAPAAPMAPPAPAMPDALGAPAMPPMRKPEDMPMDSADVLRRVKLERVAGRLGIEDAKIDGAATCDALEALVDEARREIVVKRMPHAAEIAKQQRGDALAALVAAALAQPESKGSTNTNPWASSTPAPLPQPKTDAADAGVAEFLKRQGY